MKYSWRDLQKIPAWLFILPAVLLKLYRVLFFRLKIVDPHGYYHNARGIISVTWHNRILFLPTVFGYAAKRRTVAVVSPSRDGEYVASLLWCFGIGSLRGSSKRRGAGAQLGAVKALKEGCNVSFTPDGPRGPKYVMSRGPVHLAAVSGAAVVPLSINVSRYWEFRSWDSFQIPKPFSTVSVVFGEPVYVAPDPDAAALEQARQRLEAALNAITVDKAPRQIEKSAE